MTPQRAYRLVRSAIERGKLIRPLTCARCGKQPNPTSDGRSAIHAHHSDYSKPLDVEWLCPSCHRAETPFPPVIGGVALGERNGQSKLTKDQVSLIRASAMGCKRLARQYNVNPTTIKRIRSGKYWLAAAPLPEDTHHGR